MTLTELIFNIIMISIAQLTAQSKFVAHPTAL